MRVLLKFHIDCEPDQVWELLRSPAAFRAVAAPLVTVRTPEPGGFPEHWKRGSFRVTLWLLGLVPLGEQVLDLDWAVAGAGRSEIRMLTDAGGPASGVLAGLHGWRHRMAVAPDPGGGTLYRDRLEVDGALALLAWPGLWAFWQLRGAGIRRLARRAARG